MSNIVTLKKAMARSMAAYVRAPDWQRRMPHRAGPDPEQPVPDKPPLHEGELPISGFNAGTFIRNECRSIRLPEQFECPAPKHWRESHRDFRTKHPTAPTKLQKHAQSNPVAKLVKTPFGVKYTIDGFLETPFGSRPAIRAIWIVEPDHPAPRPVTAYPL